MGTKIDAELIKNLERLLEALISECLDDAGQPKAPTLETINRARVALPAMSRYGLFGRFGRGK